MPLYHTDGSVKKCDASNCDRDAEREHNPDWTGELSTDSVWCAKHAAQLRRHGRLTPENERRSRRAPDRRHEMEPLQIGDTPNDTPDVPAVPDVPLPSFDNPTPEPTPEPTPDAKTPDADVDGLRRALESLGLGGQDPRLDDVLENQKTLAERIDAQDAKFDGLKDGVPRQHEVRIVQPDNEEIRSKFDTLHPMFQPTLELLANGKDAWLHGPAGTGKTRLGLDVAKALGVEFYASGRMTHESGLSGYVQPHDGSALMTPFRQAWEHGGVFIFDDADASNPQALSWANMALSNKIASFIDGMVEQHADFRAIFTGNTNGHGATVQYIRNTMDAATVDRFGFLFVDYDETLERTLAGDQTGWVDRLHALRRACAKTGTTDVIVSTRSVVAGADMLRAGWSMDQCLDAFIWRGLEQAQRTKIEANL